MVGSRPGTYRNTGIEKRSSVITKERPHSDTHYKGRRHSRSVGNQYPTKPLHNHIKRTNDAEGFYFDLDSNFNSLLIVDAASSGSADLRLFFQADNCSFKSIVYLYIN